MRAFVAYIQRFRTLNSYVLSPPQRGALFVWTSMTCCMRSELHRNPRPCVAFSTLLYLLPSIFMGSGCHQPHKLIDRLLYNIRAWDLDRYAKVCLLDTALAFFMVWHLHLVPLGQPLEHRSTSIVKKRVAYRDANAVRLTASASVAEHTDSPHKVLDGISHSVHPH